MSVKLMSLVFQANIGDLELRGAKRRVRGSTCKLILLAYADHANDDGVAAYPSYTTLMRKTALSRQSVAHVIEALRQHGYLIPDGTSERGTNQYRIAIDKLVNPVDQEVVNPVDYQEQGVVNWVDQEVVNPVDLNHPLNHPESSRDAGASRERRAAPGNARIAPAAVRVYHEITGRYPPRAAWPEIDRVSDLDLWRRVVYGWITTGWRPTNVRGMLDWYQRGEVPPGKRAAGRRNGKTADEIQQWLEEV